MRGWLRAQRQAAGVAAGLVGPICHGDRVEQRDAALVAHGRRLVMLDPGEMTDDLVREMIEVLTSMCGRLYGRLGCPRRAVRAVTAAKNTDVDAVA